MDTVMGARSTRVVRASLLAWLVFVPAGPAWGRQASPRPTPRADVAPRDEQADAELVGRALMNADDDARAAAVRRLPEVTASMALPALQQALLDGCARVRSAAIEAVADIGGDVVVGMLTASLVDPIPDVREDAVYAIGRVGGPLALEALGMALSDPDPSVREAAALVSSELRLRRSP